MTEPWTTIVPIVSAALLGAGGLVVWVVKTLVTALLAARDQTITVLQASNKENQIEANRNRDAEAVQQASAQRMIDAQALTAKALEGVDRRLERIENKSSKSGAMPAVERPR